jgi:hypothetical protein
LTEHNADCRLYEIAPRAIQDLIDAWKPLLTKEGFQELCSCNGDRIPVAATVELELRIERGEMEVHYYNDALMKAMEEAELPGKGAGFTAWQRFRRAHKDLYAAIESMTGSTDPFTFTLRVEGKKKVYPKGPMLYSAGSPSKEDPPCSDD